MSKSAVQSIRFDEIARLFLKRIKEKATEGMIEKKQLYLIMHPDKLPKTISSPLKATKNSYAKTYITRVFGAIREITDSRVSIDDIVKILKKEKDGIDLNASFKLTSPSPLPKKRTASPPQAKKRMAIELPFITNPSYEKQPYEILFLCDTACSLKKMKMLIEYLRKDAFEKIKSFFNINFKCDMEARTKSICYKPETSTFMNEIINTIRKHIQEKKNVVVIGHSYGGYVASKIAEQFDQNSTLQPLLKSLTFATFGSTYVPSYKLEKVDKRIMHYMIKDDTFALECNNYLLESPVMSSRKQVMNKSKRIVWFAPNSDKNNSDKNNTHYIAYQDHIVTLILHVAKTAMGLKS